mmetsp:Transcript_48358/g.97300  ORF Transcript_48358/g.97300 Transcript_48358/m.97300 type:complete len:191 (+) Transcript_48358:194-766(+)
MPQSSARALATIRPRGGSVRLHQRIQEMVPRGYWIAADDAYACTEQVLTPYPGSHTRDSKEDAFNFWHSGAQRINIECAFGMLVRRWGILWRMLECSLAQNTLIIMVCMKLHNYCQRNGHLSTAGCRSTAPGEVDGEGTSPNTWFQNELHTEDVRGRRRDRETSTMRAGIASAAFAAGLRRPVRSNVPGI